MYLQSSAPRLTSLAPFLGQRLRLVVREDYDGDDEEQLVVVRHVGRHRSKCGVLNPRDHSMTMRWIEHASILDLEVLGTEGVAKLSTSLKEGDDTDALFREKLEKATDQELNIRDRWSQFSVLHWAAYVGNYHATELLLARGDLELLNGRDNNGNTALLIASRRGHADVVALLTRTEGVLLDAVNDRGESALHCAAQQSRSSEVVPILLKAGLDMHQLDFDGKLALQYAVENGHKEMSEMLSKRVGLEATRRRLARVK